MRPSGARSWNAVGGKEMGTSVVTLMLISTRWMLGSSDGPARSDGMSDGRMLFTRMVTPAAEAHGVGAHPGGVGVGVDCFGGRDAAHALLMTAAHPTIAGANIAFTEADRRPEH